MRFMFGMVVAMGLLGCGGADTDDVSGLESVGSVGEEIVGGYTSPAGEAPYQVSLRTTSHMCGGVIYNSRTVITAAHCVSGKQPSSLSVRYSSLQHGSGGTLVSVSSIVVHNSYNSSTIDNDIAVVRLSAPMTLGSTQAKAVNLPTQGSDPAVGVLALASGWGVTSSGSSSIPANLMSVKVPIVARATARASYGASAITDNMIAAGLTEGGKDTCQGDSGGPLVINGVLVGISSWGRGCALPNYPGIYTRVGNYVDWIKNNAG
ncbi:serine protease [Vitiosangium sp. GDMCC 1.1324]|uniref:S1 family serine peptidase n=1 Tax=Vitiosangium sp. (strain GDMCC 1.1324) TaxID=2138576 RepID=UPI000D3A46F6|nr:serine protease [Vitiosangium sp. GDMCC 1.1324]PTL75963.1 trypsin [Vitiosangium sp. GDMCC 1.1324]